MISFSRVLNKYALQLNFW